MPKNYRLVGSQDPANRIDRVIVEDPSTDYPEGKVLELNGEAVELSDDQYAKLAGVVKLDPTAKGDTAQRADFGPDDSAEAKSAAKSAAGASKSGGGEE